MLEIDFCLQCEEIPISCMLRRILHVARFVSFSFSFSWNRLGRPVTRVQNETDTHVSFSFS